MSVTALPFGSGVADRRRCRIGAARLSHAWGPGGVTAMAFMTGGCSRSPSQNILGSFFPAWLLCLGLGVLVAIGSRLAMGWLGYRDEVPVPLLTYLAVALATTCLLWLLWFGH